MVAPEVFRWGGMGGYRQSIIWEKFLCLFPISSILAACSLFMLDWQFLILFLSTEITLKLYGLRIPGVIVLSCLWEKTLLATLNNLARFSRNLFFFEISMDVLVLQINAWIYESMRDTRCSDIWMTCSKMKCQVFAKTMSCAIMHDIWTKRLRKMKQKKLLFIIFLFILDFLIFFIWFDFFYYFDSFFIFFIFCVPIYFLLIVDKIRTQYMYRKGK